MNPRPLLLALGLLGASALAAETAPAPPPISAHPGDKALTVAWSEPAGATGITAYDVRWILTSADETVDANWTLIDNAWTSGGLYKIVTGLTNDTAYDVQVRAVTSSVDGPWSATVEKVTPADTSDPTDLPITSDAVRRLPGPGVAIGGVLDDSNDKDGYAFVLTRDMMVTLRSSGIAGSDAVLFGTGLLTGNFETTEHLDRPTETGQEIFIQEAVGPGTYALGITPSATLGSATTYEIHWDLEPLEKDAALPLALGGSAEGVIGVRDNGNWLKVDLAEETDLLIWSYPGWLRFMGLGQELKGMTATLYDSNGKKIAVSVPPALPGLTGIAERHFVLRKELPAGTYHLKVNHHPLVRDALSEIAFRTPAYSGAYTIFADSAAAEAGNTTASATPIRHDTPTPGPPPTTPTTAFTPVGGRIDARGDVDYFRVSPTRSSYVIVGVASHEVSLDASLVDDQGNPVAMVEYKLSWPNVRAVWLANRLNAGDYYVRVASRSGTGGYWLSSQSDLLQENIHNFCSAPGSGIDDVLYSCQWHLPAIRASEAWSTASGTGITVAIVDDGLEEKHLDLTANVDRKAGRDYTGTGLQQFWSHGTRVAGLVAATGNSLGVRGVAPGATIHGRNWLADAGTQDLASLVDAMVNRASTTAISNNSWGHAIEAPSAAPEAWKRSIRQGLRTGWGGKGTVYVFAAGNGAQAGGDVNLSEFTTHYGVMAICGTGAPDADQNETRVVYSETGYTLWVCGPTAHDDNALLWVVTTGDFSKYTAGFNGTSASAPIVAGVAALVREANPALTWRDVKLILAGSAAKNDPSNSGWETGGKKHEDSTSSYNYNHEYGFGRVDAKAAVDLAGTWQLLPRFIETKPVRVSPNQIVENPPEGAKGKIVRSDITIDDEIEFIEFVEIEVDMNAPKFRDLELELVSPGGKISKLSYSQEPYRDPFLIAQVRLDALPSHFEFGSAKYLGESPEGVWTLRLQDVRGLDHHDLGVSDTVLKSWSLKFYGHRKTPGAPSVYLTHSYGKLTVSWGTPRVIGASEVTGYRLRWATETDANAGTWTTVDNAGTNGARQEVLENLTDGTRYAVQVQAINTQGSGRWSKLQIGVPGAPPPPGGGTGGGDDDGDDDDDGGDGDPPPPATHPKAAIGVDAACANGLCRALTGTPVRFEDKSSGTVRYRLWDFHGLSTSRQATVSHAFSSPGFYDVSLTVSLDGEKESVASLKFLVEAAQPAGTCQATDTTLCLQDSRFEVSLGWWTADGQSGDAKVVREGTNDSGLFWFFADDNWEMLVKVLDGCSFNNRHWVYAASATNLGYELRVRDTVTDVVKEYPNEPGMPSPAVADNEAFAGTCAGSAASSLAASRGPASPTSLAPASGAALRPSVPATAGRPTAAWPDPDPARATATAEDGGCTETATTLCLLDDRYEVSLAWSNGDEDEGPGRTARPRTDDSGLFWFFADGNWEMLVKVLDGCSYNGHRWVYAASATTVGLELTVRDTLSDDSKTYVKESGAPAPAFTDSAAFACSTETPAPEAG